MEKLTAEAVCALLDYNKESGEIRWKSKVAWFINAGDIAGHIDHEGYRCISVKGKMYKAHRLAWLMVTGEWPKQFIDHLDGCRSNNAFRNLRDTDKAMNAQNQHKAAKTSSIGYLGVSRQKSGRFQARISVKGKNIGLGTFDTPEEAHVAYLKGKRRLHPGCTL